MAKPLAGRVCVVTGATRGIGKGIALQLGTNGAKVYITGRTLDPSNGPKMGGSLQDTVDEIEARGGKCVPIQCDHSSDQDVQKLFSQIERENDGQLDILVNNAYSAVGAIFNNLDKKFWEQPITMWDEVNNVGLRNHYLCAIYAAKLMVPRKRGLIVNISSPGGLSYLFNVPYGIGKEACDRMAADCAHELQTHNVAFISLWPGAVRTEAVTHILREQIKTNSSQEFDDGVVKRDAKKSLEVFESGESTEFPGKCIVELAMDPDIMKKSGRILLTCDLAKEYNIADDHGQNPPDILQVKYLLNSAGYKMTSRFVPGFLRVPKWMLYYRGYKL